MRRGEKTHISLLSSLLLLSRGFPQGAEKKLVCLCTYIPLYKIYSKVRRKKGELNKNSTILQKKESHDFQPLCPF